MGEGSRNAWMKKEDLVEKITSNVKSRWKLLLAIFICEKVECERICTNGIYTMGYIRHGLNLRFDLISNNNQLNVLFSRVNLESIGKSI